MIARADLIASGGFHVISIAPCQPVWQTLLALDAPLSEENQVLRGKPAARIRA
jgi:hypothetical protein